jgi:predicted DsbA family dithiol-disulfide isomerase
MDTNTLPTSIQPIKIAVWSDIACPWCFIGKRKFELGVEAFTAQPGSPRVEVEYRSYELAPDTPVNFDGGEVEFLSKHKGIGEGQAHQMLKHVAGVAGGVGLHYDFDALQHVNTVRAHELLHYAKARGLQQEMTERLFTAYFEEGRNLGGIEGLADLAHETGLDREDVMRSLSENEYLADVRLDQQQAQELGVPGVPFFVVDGKYGISGAQEPEVFSGVFERVVRERAEVSI